MFVFGWAVIGLAGLFIGAAILSLSSKPGSFVSPYGTLTYLLTGVVTESQWPWKQASLGGILTKSAEDVTSAAGKSVLSLPESALKDVGL